MKRQHRKHFIRLGALSAAILTGGAQATLPVENCENLVGTQVEAGVVTAAVRVAEGDTIESSGGGLTDLFGDSGPVSAAADFCRVSLQLAPTSSSDINVDVWLPDNWNDKLFSYGGGGFSGGLGQSDSAMNDGIARGYVTATSDLGHTASTTAEWAHNQPEKVIDFGHRANHLVAVTSKQVISQYYGSPASRAYFQGCSGGGREALMEVSRYPQDYDGVIAGAPAMDWGEIMTQNIWLGQVTFWTPNLFGKLSAVNNAVMDKCDALDGVEDGVLENPQMCDFDPGEMRCGFFETNSCLTWGEVDALRKIYKGTKLANGEVIMPGPPKGSEGAGWLVAALTNLAGGPEYYKWMVFNNPWWASFAFNVDRDYPVSRSLVQPIVNSGDTDISAFTQSGGKLILHHGWSDSVISGANTVRYFEEVSENLGATSQDSVRLFMMPGQQHCGGDFDMVSKLENWVENGQAPEEVIVSSGSSTHPACPWPQTAHYNGSGSTDDAANYTCAE